MNEKEKISVIRIGDSASLSRVIKEEEVLKFAEITGDINPIHTDPDFSEKGPFKKRVVHGTLTLSTLSCILGTKLPGPGTIAREIQGKFLRPVFFGEEITVEISVVDLNVRHRFIFLKFDIKNKKNKLVCQGMATAIAPDYIRLEK